MKQEKFEDRIEGLIKTFAESLQKEEKSRATTGKYCRDVRAFLCHIGADGIISKEVVMEYKQYLLRKYAVTSANSMLTAVNIFLQHTGHADCRVKAFRIQRETCRQESRELSRNEYMRLLQAALKKGNRRLYYLMQTICATGIRISELPFITMEAVRMGQARVHLKGKVRFVTLPKKLCRELLRYARGKQIVTGSIFVTRSGRPMDRSNILHEMKALCAEAGVDRSKVFPHNLRHLFAVTFYKKEKDICHLADILGHATVNTTRIYTLISSAEQGRKIDRLGLVV